ncbi:hypothetical protein E3N88_06996 [Mikania micrantha]|uniref:Uncharacterized protein n=1 Tax=Mikania micrantha TaxID=192012 RepID=A0A5N6PSQ1_9ASTR|nr:hypothetical protein E3N88_06996 [Mikania micrantha]
MEDWGLQTIGGPQSVGDGGSGTSKNRYVMEERRSATTDDRRSHNRNRYTASLVKPWLLTCDLAKMNLVPTRESSDWMPPTFRASKRPRFESDDIVRLTWESKWANDRIEHLAQELRDANARYAELRSVVQGMESHMVHLTTRVQEEEHRADIAEGSLIALEEQFVSDAKEEEEEEEKPAQDVDSDADSTIEDA